jgi:O-antigen ligase
MSGLKKSSGRKRIKRPMSSQGYLLLWGLLFCVPGMAFFYAGAQFWASIPFIIPACLMMFTYQVQRLRAPNRRQNPAPLPSGIFFGGFLLLYILIRTVFFPSVPYQAWTEVFQIVFGFLLYGVCTELRVGKKSWNHVVLFLCIAGALQAMYAFWLHRNGLARVLWLPRPASYEMRASGTWICPNHFAHYLQMIFVCAASTFVIPRVPIHVRIVAGYSMVLMLPALVLSQSRSGLLGTVVGVGLLIFLMICRKGWKKTVGVSALLLIMLVGLCAGIWKFYPPFFNRLVKGLTDDIRYSQFWPDTWRMIQGEGFWGVGPGVFRHAFDTYRESFHLSSIFLHYAHNEYLHWIAEYGWAMVLFAGVALTGWCFKKVRAVFRAEDTEGAGLAALQVSVVVSSFVHAIFDFNLHITANALTFLLIVGLLEGMGDRKQVWALKTLNPFWSRCTAFGISLVLIALIPFSVKLFMGSYHEYQLDVGRKRQDLEAQTVHAERIRFWTPSYWRGWTELGFQKRSAAFLIRNPERRKALIDESRAAYEQGLRWNPYDRIALAGLVELSKMEKDYETALSAINELQALSPFDVQIRIQKGLILQELDRYEESLAVFQEAKRLRARHDEQIELNIRYLKSKIK